MFFGVDGPYFQSYFNLCATATSPQRQRLLKTRPQLPQNNLSLS